MELAWKEYIEAGNVNVYRLPVDYLNDDEALVRLNFDVYSDGKGSFSNDVASGYRWTEVLFKIEKKRGGECSWSGGPLYPVGGVYKKYKYDEDPAGVLKDEVKKANFHVDDMVLDFVETSDGKVWTPGYVWKDSIKAVPHLRSYCISPLVY
ncbi:hypothetical protein [Chromobacterium sp. IIBBL 290-4]|uniref:hypothetical protein n=1 Tax=Chromobacterium sp. IIBBL 290-4 TaxID=2953890 RepID=UPI0020B7D468|nr:hypothetical protein [Chromobacterium sp. IIBBL 290-4]UTH73617.1 hypothetical protein NKT35_19055 [Chromobacterium sp. IIBBL 290-4]